MHKFLLSCNGDYFPSKKHDEIIRNCDYFMAVDGGIRHLVSLNIEPNLWVGDMDSAVDFELPNLSVKKENLNTRKDFSDSEYAVNRAIELGARSIVMIGSIGSRIDHSIFNLNLILKKSMENIDIVILDGRQEIRVLKKENIIEGNKGMTLSIVPFGEIKSLTMSGFSYPTKNIDLERFSGLTLSNEIIEDRASINVTQGTGVIVISEGY